MSRVPPLSWTLLGVDARRELIRAQECGRCYALAGDPCRNHRMDPLGHHHASRLSRAIEEFRASA